MALDPSCRASVLKGFLTGIIDLTLREEKEIYKRGVRYRKSNELGVGLGGVGGFRGGFRVVGEEFFIGEGEFFIFF